MNDHEYPGSPLKWIIILAAIALILRFILKSILKPG